MSDIAGRQCKIKLYKCLLCGSALIQTGLYAHCRHCGSKYDLEKMLAVQRMIADLKDEARELASAIRKGK